MFKPYNSKHIRTQRNIKSFRHCKSHTGEPLQIAAHWRLQREEMKLASRLWHHRLDGCVATECHRCRSEARTRAR